MSSRYGVTLRRTKPLRLARYPDAPVAEEWHQWVRDSTRPIAIDLFCGAGGLSHGLEAAGYRVALSVDLDEWAVESHAHNLSGLALRRDLAIDESRNEIAGLFNDLEVDLIAAGPPCQPFSRAGRSKIRHLVDLGIRDAVDTREELWRAFLDLADRIKPRAVLMENVPDMAFADGTILLRSIIDRLERIGYKVDARIVNTWLYGVPQHRQRLILVGVRDGSAFNWPDTLEQVTVRDAIGDLPILDVMPDNPIGSEVMEYGFLHVSDFSRKARKECTGDSAELLYDHVTRAVRQDDYKAFELMEAGTLYSELPDDVKRYRDDIFDDKYKRLDWSSLSRSITAHIAKDGYWYIHPDQHRTLTVREAARIQTFPDTFRFAGSRSHQFHQIGNAVPPILSEVVGSAILASLRRDEAALPKRSVDRELFRQRLVQWAAKDKEDAPWAYPGEPWLVTVGLLAGSKGKSNHPTPGKILELAPKFKDAIPKVFSKLEAIAHLEHRRHMIERLSKVVTSVKEHPDGWASDNWRDIAQFGPSARSWYELMTGRSDRLVASSAVLRVTARVTGTDVDRRNRGSEGRMELAKLIGHGKRAVTLNSAMHRLGSTTCLPKKPICKECPVQEVCQDSEL